MNNDTTVASNDESSKKANEIKVANTNEMKTNYVSDEEVRKDIKEKWGEEVYVAAIDAEFIENIIAQEDAASSSTSSDGRRRRRRGRVKVTTQVAIALNHLINNSLVTIGAKEEKGKFKKARENAKLAKNKKNQEAKQQEQEK